MGTFAAMATRWHINAVRGGGRGGAGGGLGPTFLTGGISRGVLLFLVVVGGFATTLFLPLMLSSSHRMMGVCGSWRLDEEQTVAFQSSMALAKNFFSERAQQHPAIITLHRPGRTSSEEQPYGEDETIELIPTDGYYQFQSRVGSNHVKNGRRQTNRWDGEILLQFRTIPEGWVIYDNGKAKTAQYRIEEGKIAHDGSGWWIVADYRSSERTVVHGKLDFENNDFRGSWKKHSRMGISAGTFDMFELVQKLPTIVSSNYIRPGPGRRESIIEASGRFVE